MMVSDKANQIGESPTLKITSKVKAMKAEGIDVVDLGVGEPDFPTPEPIKEAGIRAIRDNFTKYTQNEGIPALKDAVIHRLQDDHGLHYERDQVIISSGAKSALYHLIQALVNSGDEVIIPSPYWVTYPHAVALAQGKSVVIPTREEDGFLLTPEQLKAAVSPSTKALILNNPSNPTGAVYSKAQLEALAEVILEEDIFVIADEIYEKLVYDDFAFSSFAGLDEPIKKKTVIIGGVSKSYSMTGWRIGYAAGPSEVIGGMAKIQSHTTSNPCSISQMAALQALKGPQHDVSRMVAEFQRRRNYLLMRLQSIRDVSCFKPQGAFYLFPNFSSFYKKEFNNSLIRNSYGLSYFLLREARVAVVPGDAFGSDDYIRFSYATSMENLEKGMDRIMAALLRLKTPKKAKKVALNNTPTQVRKPVPVESPVTVPMRDALAAEMESHLSFENYFEWNANINGVIVQLRTNVPHLADFWVDNWYPAQLETDLEPHGVIYAVDGIPGREPRSYYSPETKTGIMVNCDAYGPLRSLALGLVMDISERLSHVYALRGMSGEHNGNGFILIGPKGTRKTELFFDLVKENNIRLQANDLVFVRFGGGQFIADGAERKLFMPTNTADIFPALAPLFDSSKCENVVLKKEDCQNDRCLQLDDCRLDRGSPFCYKAAKNAYAMLDPYWIGGPDKHAKRTVLRHIFILRSDATSPPAVTLGSDEALRILEQGESAGAKRELGPPRGQPYFNPHILPTTPDHLEAQRNFFRKLLDSVPCLLFNSGVAAADELQAILAAGSGSGSSG